MSEITVKAGKFQRLLDYMGRIGLDVDAIAATINVAPRSLARLDADVPLPAQHYSHLYKQAVQRMQAEGRPLPWAAGLGSEAFELMCHCMISSRTLGEALRIAERYEALVYPITGYNIRLLDDGADPLVKLSYRINIRDGGEGLGLARMARFLWLADGPDHECQGTAGGGPLCQSGLLRQPGGRFPVSHCV
jgi:hypothetical protein